MNSNQFKNIFNNLQTFLKGKKDKLLSKVKKTSLNIINIFNEFQTFLKGKKDKLLSTPKKINFDIILIKKFILIIIIYSILFDKIKIDIKSISNLTAIYSIIGAVLGSLFIFIMAEGLRDKKEPYKIKIFLNESKLITIIVLFLISLTLLLFQGNRFIVIISFSALLGFIFLSIYAISQIALITLNTEELWKKHINLFKKSIKEVMDFEADLRLESQKFHEFINNPKNIGIQWFSPKKEEQEVLRSKKEGTIVALDLPQLEILIQKIRKISDDKKTEATPERSEDLEISPLENNQKKQKGYNPKKISLQIEIRNKIRKRDGLLFYDRNIKLDKTFFENQLNKSITVNSTTVVDNIRTELESYRTMIKRCIKENNIFQFEKCFSLYFSLAEECLKQLSKEEKYNYQKAKREMSSFLLDDWSPLLWLKEHIMDFFNQSKSIKIDQDNNQIYSHIKWFTYKLISISIEEKEHLLFQTALHLWQRQLYILCEESDQIKKDIEDHLKFFKEHIMPFGYTMLNRMHVTEEKEDYAIHLLEVLKNIFIQLHKQNLLEKFKELIEIIVDNHYGHRYKLKINDEIFEKPDSYESRKLQFFFGLGAFLEELPDKENQLEDIKEFIKDTVSNSFKRITFDLKNYMRIYPLMRSKNVDHFWMWSFFNLPPDGVWRVKEDNIKRYFLKFMSDISEKEFSDLQIASLDQITISKLEYLSLTQNLKMDKNIKLILEKISKYQYEKRLKYVVESKLDTEKIENFNCKFKQHFEKENNMRKLFKYKQKIKYKENIYKKESIWQINKLQKKSFFIPEECASDHINLDLLGVGLSNMPESFSFGFINSENKFLQSEILKKCKKIEISHNDFKKELLDRKWNKNEILLFKDNVYHDIIMDSRFYKIPDSNS